MSSGKVYYWTKRQTAKGLAIARLRQRERASSRHEALELLVIAMLIHQLAAQATRKKVA